jgi:hypothetical protein
MQKICRSVSRFKPVKEVPGGRGLWLDVEMYGSEHEWQCFSQNHFFNDKPMHWWSAEDIEHSVGVIKNDKALPSVSKLNELLKNL